jgi:vacuolar protein sorting-associated protein 13A/C
VHFSLFNVGTQAVEISVESVNIVVSPKNKEDWDLYETQETEFDLRALVINQITQQFFESRTTAEHAHIQKKQDGFVTTLIKKIVDNLQIDIKDVHIRMESSNPQFSMGVTLKQFKIETTNE